MKNNEKSLACAGHDGTVYEFPGMEPAFRTGNRLARVDPGECIELPYGSYLFSLPGRYPVFYNETTGDFRHVVSNPGGEEIQAVSAFLASGYLRTYLPASVAEGDAPVLPLWAYTGVAVIGGEFRVPAMRIDDDPRSDPAIHRNNGELKKAISSMRDLYGDNRLVGQLSRCAAEYNCLCARNFFLERHEAPVPTTPPCNARCAGCLSHQDPGSGFPPSQERLDFEPKPEEIAEVILHHFEAVPGGVASFGQGCEGEPILRAKDLARAVSLVREKTGAGTVNINTNGSLPVGVRELIGAGIDSVRISLNSPTEKYYTRYYRPAGYSFGDVLRSIETALEAGVFVSLNLFFMPGFTDMETEAEALFAFLEKYPVNMIQARNLNMDPDRYFEAIAFDESEPIGVRNLVSLIREEFPKMKIGYYNPPKENFKE